MKKAAKPKGPSKHFFAVDNAAFEGMLYRFRVPNIDRRVWGWLVRHSWGLRANDRQQVDRAKVALALGVHPKSVDGALQSLERHGAIIRYTDAKRGQPAVYGPNKKAESWTYPLESGMEPPVRCAKPTHQTEGNEYPGSTHPIEKGCAEPTHLTSSNRLTQLEETDSPNSQASPSTPTVCTDPKTQILNTEIKHRSKTPNPQGGMFDPEPVLEDAPAVEQITTAKQAVRKQAMSIAEAVVHAERAYFKLYARSLSGFEQAKLSEFFSLSEFRGSLLAIWLEALEDAYDDRRERKADPDQARYVAKNPFKDVYQFAADDYADRRARSTPPSPRPPQSESPDSSARREAAGGPIYRKGALV